MLKEFHKDFDKISCIPDAYMQCAFPRHIFRCVFVLPDMKKLSVTKMDIEAKYTLKIYGSQLKAKLFYTFYLYRIIRKMFP